MISRGLIAGAVLLISASVGAAQPAEQTDTAAAADLATPPAVQSDAAGHANANTASEKKVCRSDKVTGSLSRRNRICLTQAQWREVHDRTRRGVGEMQNDASGSQVCQYEDPNRTSPCY